MISRKGLVHADEESSETLRQASRRRGSKIKSDLHGDMQRLAEMTNPYATSVEQQK